MPQKKLLTLSNVTARKWIAFTACWMRNSRALALTLRVPTTPLPTWLFFRGCTHKAQQIELQKFPHVQRWYDALFKRPAVKRGLDLGKELRQPALTDEARQALFGQTTQSVQSGAHTNADPKKSKRQ